MRQHLLDDPDAQPAGAEEAEVGWLRLSSRLTHEIGRLADRDDLIVQAAPGAGRGSPGCFVPALATIEVDGHLLPAGVDPARARPRRLSDRERYPVLWGVLSHEAGHARHTRWQAPDDAPAAAVAAAKLLAGVALGDAEVGQELGDQLGGHRGAAVGVDGELVAPDALLGKGVGSCKTPMPFGRRDG